MFYLSHAQSEGLELGYSKKINKGSAKDTILRKTPRIYPFIKWT